MKAIFLIILAIVLGFLCYTHFIQQSPPSTDTPLATAKAFITAAAKSDMTAVQDLCTDAARDSAVRVAKQIGSFSPDPAGARYQNMIADPPRRGMMAMISGRVVAIEMIEQEGEWKIAEIQITQQ
jgi:hypothetical protein